MKIFSIERRLIRTTASIIFVFGMGAALIAASSAFQRSQKFQDRLLERSALLTTEAEALPFRRNNDEQILVKTPDDADFHNFVDLDYGFHDLKINSEKYRVFVGNHETRGLVVAMQKTTLRNRAAMRGAIWIGLPFLFFLPLPIFGIVIVIRMSLAPVNRLARMVEISREEYEQIPIDVLPLEIKSYTKAINRLLAKNHQTIVAQKRFIADAAHELRTPLAVLTLQADDLLQEQNPAVKDEKIKELRNGVLRANRLISQMLDLARSQNNAVKKNEVSRIGEVFMEVIQALYPFAQSKNTDLGISENALLNAKIPADKNTLYTIIKNLAENAIKYSPPNSQVDLNCVFDDKSLIISVEDNGLGIPEEELKEVLKPFKRLAGQEQEGSGLGLAIVAELSQKLGAKLKLQKSDNYQSGLLVSLSFNNLTVF